MEAYYEIQQLPGTNHQFKRNFSMACIPDDWMFIAKDKETFQELYSSSENVKLSGNIDKYTKRQITLEDWCVADFVVKLTSNMQKTQDERHTKGYGYCY